MNRGRSAAADGGALTVTLGPEARLHRGYHGALLDHPPPSVEYSVEDPTVVFASYARTADFSPCDHFAVLERHVYGDRPSFVHSVHFPVGNDDVKWALETDSLLAHLQYGNVVFNPRFSRWIQDARAHALVAERLANMLELLASPRCVALVFHSRAQIESNQRQCLAVMPSDWGAFVEELFGKAVVCYPAQPPRITEERLRSRNANGRRGIVFAASGFEEKGGHVTLELYRRLLLRRDVELCYFGPIPAAAKSEFADVLARIQYASQIPRDLLLEVFAEAHILVFPSRHEALGITLFEALSSGLALVATKGPGMENVFEIVEEGGGGVLVQKPSIDRDPPVEELFEAVVALLEDRDRYEAMSLHNLSLVQDGPFSLERRNETLLAVYGSSEGTEASRARHSPTCSASRKDRDDHPAQYACRFSAVAAATRDCFRETTPATESSLLVPGLSIADVAPGAGPKAGEKRLLSDLSSSRIRRVRVPGPRTGDA